VLSTPVAGSIERCPSNHAGTLPGTREYVTAGSSSVLTSKENGVELSSCQYALVAVVKLRVLLSTTARG